MFTTRFVRSNVTRMMLASLALLPLTACSADSINAVKGLLKEAATSDRPQAQPKPQGVANGQPGAQPGNAANPGPGSSEGRPGQTPGSTASVGVQAHNDGPAPSAQPKPPVIKPEHDCHCERVLLRVRWGQFTANPAIPVWTPWRGRLKTENAQIRMVNTILYEAGDQILPSPPDQIGFMTRTKPHYDGFTAVMRFDHDRPGPKLIVNTNYGNKVFTMPELASLNFTRQVDPLGNKFQIRSVMLPPLPGHCRDDMPVPDMPELRFEGEDQPSPELEAPAPTEPEPALAPESQEL